MEVLLIHHFVFKLAVRKNFSVDLFLRSKASSIDPAVKNMIVSLKCKWVLIIEEETVTAKYKNNKQRDI